jgi:hypothetical protein
MSEPTSPNPKTREVQRPEEIVRDIKQMMERSSRFISLSGWSGVAAGICALVAAFIVAGKIGCWRISKCLFERLQAGEDIDELRLFFYTTGAATFVVAFGSAFLFTWLRSKKTSVPLWGNVARRLMWAVAWPLIVGAIFLFRMIQLEQFELVAPGCLVFYGLALLNASKYTLPEIRYLGFAQIILGLVNAWMPGYGLHFWAAGFGALHIVYGLLMWARYERV